MRVLVAGSGAREHALLWKLAQSPRIGLLLCAPGNAGTAELAENIPVAVNDLDAIVQIARTRRVDLVVVGPEEPLALGLADRLSAAGLRVFGPSQAATRIESSKSWAKEIMLAAGVPTARAVVATGLPEALAAVGQFGFPVAIKADGLAAGKGVVIAASMEEAHLALTAMLEQGVLGEAGRRVVIEEALRGSEVSVLGITDGSTVLTLPAACDYKRAFDADRGPNTGGMGAYAPAGPDDDRLLDSIRTSILEPVVREMAARGAAMRGVLYAGLMLTPDGPKVLEFNARFGDPETQVVLPLADLDLLELCEAVVDGTLADVPPLPRATGAAVGVVLASGGYPGPYRTGLPIAGLDAVADDVLVFHAGTRRDEDGKLATAGGRVLTVVGQAADLGSARDRAYAGATAIAFEGMQFRSDIGKRELVP